ncbi:hypothetical protein SAMN04487950_2325 [Halogranum rubrum]|uniref:Uncharacterized protein n=1 Tax=Halogranum rubrum TaxID=553466 RepID=A0A1I4EUQ0_9EURY|nr:hypothetical protein [Halogranum rubrum]SFL07871.1 hypothetical protein SAMN04487950_2325 [Halogranum rubrum]
MNESNIDSAAEPTTEQPVAADADTSCRLSRRDVVRTASVAAMVGVGGTGVGTATSTDDDSSPPPVFGRDEVVRWYRTGDRDGEERFRDAIATADGGVTTVGAVTLDADRSEAWQYAWDAIGDKRWTARQGDPGFDSAFGGVRTTTGGYVLCGRTRRRGRENDRFYVVATGPRGTERWTQRFHVRRCDDDRANDVVQTAGGDYAVAGIAADSAALAKLGPDGTVEWTNTYGGGRAVEVVTVVAVDDGYVLAGTVTHSESTRQFLLLKTDETGREQWRRTYSAGEDSRLTDCTPTENGYVLAGTTSSENAFTTNALVVRTDSRGRLVWEQTYGASGEEYTAEGITATARGYAVVGTRSSDVVGPQLWLGGLDEDGEWTWRYAFGTERPEIPDALTTTSDGFAVVSGFTDSAEVDDRSDGFVAKVTLPDQRS